MKEQNATVTVTTKNTTALTMGIIAIVLGVLAMLVAWLPFLGLLAIPVAVIGLLLALIGVILAAIRKFNGLAMPLLGGVICGIAVVISISSTGSTSLAITEAMEESGKARQAAEEKETKEEKEYIANYIELYDVEAKYHDSLLDGTVPGVLFKIKNTGDRTLNKVEVTVYFKDAGGSIIAEEDYFPVLVSEYSFNDDKPLKPGYIWSMEKNKFYSAKSVSTEWEEGSVDIEITDIELAPEEIETGS
jgi:hypothetical protein